MSHYKTLGLKKGATIPEIKRKYRELCMIHHPDKGGNTTMFIKIKDAYEALLNGDSGEDDIDSETYRQYQKAKQAYNGRNAKRTPGEFRFVHIKKCTSGYLFKFFLNNVRVISVYGKDDFRVGLYDVSDVNGHTNLVLSYEEAKLAKYYFKLVLEDFNNGYAEKIFKVKNPDLKWWEKILIKLKIIEE